MKKFVIILFSFQLISCGYHLRVNNSLAEEFPQMKLQMKARSLLKRPLINALIASGVELKQESNEDIDDLVLHQDTILKVIQSIGANNQVQEYRLEYDVVFSVADSEKKSIHLERDYSFDIQQIAGGQQEEQTLRRQLAEDMARAIIRQLSLIQKEKK